MGRLPLRAQVVATGSRKEKPNSSKEHDDCAEPPTLFFILGQSFASQAFTSFSSCSAARGQWFLNTIA